MSNRYVPSAELARQVAAHPARQALVPLECNLSWWVPIVRPSDGRLFLTAFFYTLVGLRGEPKRVTRPVFTVAVDAANGQLVELTNCAYRDFAAAVSDQAYVGVIEPGAGPAGTLDELAQRRAAVYAELDAVFPVAFTAPAELSPEQRAAAQRLQQSLVAMVEPFLQPFYRAMNPAFFEWLDLAAA